MVIAPLELASPVLGWVAMCVCASIPFLCGPTSHPLSWNTMEGVSIFQPAAGLRNSEHEGREPAVLLKAGAILDPSTSQAGSIRGLQGTQKVHLSQWEMSQRDLASPGTDRRCFSRTCQGCQGLWVEWPG